MVLSIIILSYNTKDLTISCISSIVDLYREELKRKEFEIIVVDNASTDCSIEAINKEVKEKYFNIPIQLIQNKENIGFSKGNNVGFSKSNGEYVVFVNSDIEVKDNGLSKMVQFLGGHENIAVLGGRLVNSNGSLQSSAGKFYTLLNAIIVLFGGERVGLIRFSPSRIKEVDWVSGAFFMIRRSVFEECGGFDEKIFMYMEDMELCYRINKKGYKVYFFPDIKIKHVSLGSSSKAFAVSQIYKGIIFFYKKHLTRVETLIISFILRLKAIILVILGIILGRKDLIQTYRGALGALS